MSENVKKKDRVITTVITAVIVLLIGFNIFSYYGASFVLPGKPLPFISGADPETGTASTIDLSNGEFIINFWATWCGACVSEMGDLNKIAQKYSVYGAIKKPFKKDVYSAVEPAFKSVIWDDELFNEYYISVLPTTVFVKNGVIVKVHTGPFSEKIADKWLLSNE